MQVHVDGILFCYAGASISFQKSSEIFTNFEASELGLIVRRSYQRVKRLYLKKYFSTSTAS